MLMYSMPARAAFATSSGVVMERGRLSRPPCQNALKCGVKQAVGNYAANVTGVNWRLFVSKVPVLFLIKPPPLSYFRTAGSIRHCHETPDAQQQESRRAQCIRWRGSWSSLPLLLPLTIWATSMRASLSSPSELKVRLAQSSTSTPSRVRSAVRVACAAPSVWRVALYAHTPSSPTCPHSCHSRREEL